MKKVLLLLAAAGSIAGADAARVTHIPMDISNGKLTETVGGGSVTIYGVHDPENVAGAVGKALRLDGYSSFAVGTLSSPGSANGQAMTVSMWVAPETYPIIQIDVPNEKKVMMAGTLDDAAHSGWAFSIGQTGKYTFECYSAGWKVTVDASDVIPCGQWSHIAAVVDGSTRKATIYRNGIAVGEARCMTTVDNSAAQIRIGKDNENLSSGDFLLNTFNGLIDEIEVFDTALSAGELSNRRAENAADLTIPESRFADDPNRPRFHAMPGANWTNECHGMTYSNGRYHVFFQKNANGPYMARLHWGHVSSENLYDWREEKIAIAPGASYDVKGCWSGCVFTDDAITGGKPNILYTGVDYGRAVIAQAAPADEDLTVWNKLARNPIINGRPNGLSDDFRDPYFFRNGDKAYIIVGSSKDGKGVTTLHRYDAGSGNWSNSGELFFSATAASTGGSFWEMPNVTRMENGKWLFTATPLGSTSGVQSLYWTGDINSDGTFAPDAASSAPRKIELIARDGFGLLSPTIYQHEGKTIALGIVPDKLPGAENYRLGWAHTYSLPREWTIGDDGSLWQKPYAGLEGMRGAVNYGATDFELNGERALGTVGGRQVEVLGRFVIGNQPFGFNVLKNNVGAAEIRYIPSTNQLTVDLRSLNRIVNDGGVFDGLYRVMLPERPSAGTELKLNVFVDGSILDIFVNDRWATSIRVFVRDNDADGVEAVAPSGAVQVRELRAWNLSADGSAGIFDTVVDNSEDPDALVDVFNIMGQQICSGVRRAEATEGLNPGIYIVGGKKVIVR